MAKILIIRLSSIGDIVLASPVFRCVKKQLKDTEVHFLTKASFKAVTENNPYINRFFYYNDNLDELLPQLKAEQYDYVIDLHNNIRSNKVKRALKRKAYTINKLSVQKFLLTKLNINLMPGRHITQRSLDTVAALGVKDDGGGLDFFIADENKVPITDIPTAHHAGYICIVIGANYYTKKLPVHKLQELCKKINHPIILVGGKAEQEEGDMICAADPIKIYNSCGKFNLQESADIIRRSKLVVSHDTGMQYIACALGKEVIAIWGGTSPKLDVEPYFGSNAKGGMNAPYENVVLNLRCQPCSKYGTKTCPLEHFNCMEKINLDDLVSRIRRRLSNYSPLSGR